MLTNSDPKKMVDVHVKSPHGSVLLAIIGIASAVVFLAGAFRCGRAGWRNDGNRDFAEGDRFGNSGNDGSGCGGDEAYALSAGLVSLVVIVCLLIAQNISSGTTCAAKAGPIVGVCLFAWWLVGAAILTFHGPFYVVSNGYIGAWVAFFTSVAFALEVSELMQKAASLVTGEANKINVHLLVVLVGSIVELVAAALVCSNGCGGYVAYAVAVGATSLFFCLVLVVGPQLSASANQLAFPIAVFLFLWWFVGAVILTFITPFVVASNGFWATWASAMATTLVAKDAFVAREHGRPTAAAVVASTA